MCDFSDFCWYLTLFNFLFLLCHQETFLDYKNSVKIFLEIFMKSYDYFKFKI